jgi:hypothetical protein
MYLNINKKYLHECFSLQHGAFEKGVRSSLESIMDPMENVFLIQTYVKKIITSNWIDGRIQ